MKRFRFRNVFLMIRLWAPQVKLKSEIWPNINNSVLSARDIRSPLNPNEWLRFTHAHARTINWPSAKIIWGLNIQQWVSYLNRIPTQPESLIARIILSRLSKLHILVSKLTQQSRQNTAPEVTQTTQNALVKWHENFFFKSQMTPISYKHCF